MEDVKEGKDYNFPTEETEVLRLWDEIDAFKEQLRRTEGQKKYSFYDGPPFATGLPHYGLQLQDIVTRYASTTGHHCPRRFGCASMCTCCALGLMAGLLCDTSGHVGGTAMGCPWSTRLTRSSVSPKRSLVLCLLPSPPWACTSRA